MDRPNALMDGSCAVHTCEPQSAATDTRSMASARPSVSIRRFRRAPVQVRRHQDRHITTSAARTQNPAITNRRARSQGTTHARGTSDNGSSLEAPTGESCKPRRQSLVSEQVVHQLTEFRPVLPQQFTHCVSVTDPQQAADLAFVGTTLDKPHRERATRRQG